MAGKFTGLKKEEWEFLKPLFSRYDNPRKGKPHAPFLSVINTIFWVMITGARWADVPIGKKWAKRSTAHRWLGEWTKNGTLLEAKNKLLEIGGLFNLIDWLNSSIDGMFAAGKGGGEGVAYGFKGKGVTLHAMVDGAGMPLDIRSTGADVSERSQVEPLLDSINVKSGEKGRPRKRPEKVQLDKGYDSDELRKKNQNERNSAKNSKKNMAGKKKASGKNIKRKR